MLFQMLSEDYMKDSFFFTNMLPIETNSSWPCYAFGGSLIGLLTDVIARLTVCSAEIPGNQFHTSRMGY